MAQINIAEIRPSGTIEGKVDALYDAYFMMRKQMMYYLSGALDSDNVIEAATVKADWVYAGAVKTDQLIAGDAKIGTALIENLEVGSNVTMGANATISWSQVTSQPSIPSTADITQITANYIATPNLVTNIAQVNRYLSLGGGYQTSSSLTFDGIGSIDASGGTMSFSAFADIVFNTYTYFNAYVDGLEGSGYAKTSTIQQWVTDNFVAK